MQFDDDLVVGISKSACSGAHGEDIEERGISHVTRNDGATSEPLPRLVLPQTCPVYTFVTSLDLPGNENLRPVSLPANETLESLIRDLQELSEPDLEHLVLNSSSKNPSFDNDKVKLECSACSGSIVDLSCTEVLRDETSPNIEVYAVEPTESLEFQGPNAEENQKFTSVVLPVLPVSPKLSGIVMNLWSSESLGEGNISDFEQPVLESSFPVKNSEDALIMKEDNLSVGLKSSEIVMNAQSVECKGEKNVYNFEQPVISSSFPSKNVGNDLEIKEENVPAIPKSSEIVLNLQSLESVNERNASNFEQPVMASSSFPLKNFDQDVEIKSVLKNVLDSVVSEKLNLPATQLPFCEKECLGEKDFSSFERPVIESFSFKNSEEASEIKVGPKPSEIIINAQSVGSVAESNVSSFEEPVIASSFPLKNLDDLEIKSVLENVLEIVVSERLNFSATQLPLFEKEVSSSTSPEEPEGNFRNDPINSSLASNVEFDTVEPACTAESDTVGPACTVEIRFECEICSLKFVKQTNLDRHKSKHSNLKVYCCDSCDTTFLSDEELFLHNVKLHSCELRCQDCNLEFATRPELEEHDGNHSNKSPFLCVECHMTFKKFSEFCLHSSQHTGEDVYKCTTCPSVFRCERDLLSHQNMLHPTNSSTQISNEVSGEVKTNAKCESKKKLKRKADNLLIDNSVVTESRVNMPRKRTAYNCGVCGKKFDAAADLNSHVSSHKLQPRKCSLTAKQKIKMSSLPLHGDANVCMVCFDTFTSAIDLKYHVKSNHTDAFKESSSCAGGKNNDCSAMSVERSFLCKSDKNIELSKCKKNNNTGENCSIVDGEPHCSSEGTFNLEHNVSIATINQLPMSLRRSFNYCTACFESFDELSGLIEHKQLHPSVINLW